MAKTDDVQVQLATRVPKGLLRDAKLHAIKRDERLLTFIERALREQMAREAKR